MLVRQNDSQTYGSWQLILCRQADRQTELHSSTDRCAERRQVAGREARKRTDEQTDKQTDRQKGSRQQVDRKPRTRQTERHIGRQRNKQISR